MGGGERWCDEEPRHPTQNAAARLWSTHAAKIRIYSSQLSCSLIFFVPSHL